MKGTLKAAICIGRTCLSICPQGEAKLVPIPSDTKLVLTKNDFEIIIFERLRNSRCTFLKMSLFASYLRFSNLHTCSEARERAARVSHNHLGLPHGKVASENSKGPRRTEGSAFPRVKIF